MGREMSMEKYEVIVSSILNPSEMAREILLYMTQGQHCRIAKSRWIDFYSDDAREDVFVLVAVAKGSVRVDFLGEDRILKQNECIMLEWTDMCRMTAMESDTELYWVYFGGDMGWNFYEYLFRNNAQSIPMICSQFLTERIQALIYHADQTSEYERSQLIYSILTGWVAEN